MHADQREYYHVAIHLSPNQESYEVGSQVKLNCKVTPSPDKYRNFTFPLSYGWYSAVRGGFYSGSTATITIASNDHPIMHFYCLIYRGSILLGKGQTVLNIRGESTLILCLLLTLKATYCNSTYILAMTRSLHFVSLGGAPKTMQLKCSVSLNKFTLIYRVITATQLIISICPIIVLTNFIVIHLLLQLRY